MIDATEGITEQDKKIAGVAHEAGKRYSSCSKQVGFNRKRLTYYEKLPKRIRQRINIYVLCS